MSEDDAAEDDWFESAVRDERGGDSDAGSPDSDAPADAFDGDDPTPASDTDGTADGPGSESPLDDADGGRAFEEAGDGSGFAGGTDNPFGDTGAGSPFEGADADSALGGADAGGGSEEGLFDESFTDAMGSMGGGGGSDFEDEDLESNIPRIDLGIEGLDNMIQGGVPMRHLIVIVGGAGTGKTTFGLQFLQHGLAKEDTDTGVFITLEQSYEDIMATAAERDWEFERHEAEDNLAIIDLDPIEMANSLDNIRGELPDLIEDFDADRFVLDSVSLLEMMYDQQARRRTEVFDFTQSLKEAGVTTVLTSEADEDNPYVSRHGIIEYLTDAVFLLRYVRSETQETRLAVEIQKIRNANHSRETKPYEITLDGIDVYEQANIF